MSSLNQPKNDKALSEIDFSECRTTQEWISKIDDNFIDIFGEYLHQIKLMDINSVSLNIDKALKVIRTCDHQDIILRALNNIFYSEAGTHLNDINRAAVLLGFQSVRNVVLLYSALYTILQANPGQFIIQKELALSVHSAIIASLMENARNKSRNLEPSITALMLPSLAKLILLSLGGDNAALYCQRAEHRDLDEEDERTLFGFSFNEFAIQLSHAWNFGDVLQGVLQHESGTHSYHYILLARNLSFTLNHGWRSKIALSAIQAVEKWLSYGVTEMSGLLMRSVEMAFEELDLYQNQHLLDHIKLPHSQAEELECSAGSDELIADPDPRLVKVLIKQLITWGESHKGRDFDTLLRYACDNMRDVLDVDRVLLAFITPDHNFLHGRYISENQQSDFLNDFQVALSEPEGWLFQHVLREKRAAWIGNKGEKILRRYRNAALNQIVGRNQFFMSPIVVRGKSIGLFFVDRAHSKRALNLITYEAFISICQAIDESIEKIEY